MKYKWTWVAVGMFLFLSLWNEVVFSNDNVTNQYGYDWTFEPHEDGSIHVKVKITLGEPTSSYSFPSSFPVDLLSGIGAFTEETGEEIEVIGPEEELPMYRFEFGDDTEKPKGFNFIVEFDLMNWVEEIDVEIYSFSWEWIVDHKTSHTASIVLGEHELLSVEPPPDQDQFIAFNKAVPKLTPFEFEVTFSKKGKELIEEGEEDFEQGEANNDRLLLEKARSEYLEAITFYSKLRTIYGRDKDEFLNELEARVKKINQLLEEPETPFYHDWTFTVSEDDRSVHVAAKITLGSPRLSYSFMVPDN
ncbi:MAG: hypothetical protein HXS54_08950, partial [Theionarchaea archaeon]|nr:hypothetical protein [Theionarchaea archaeon]